jgi:ligand-binding sensor domain-containing protein
MLIIRNDRVVDHLPIGAYSPLDRFLKTPYGLWYKGGALYHISGNKITDSLPGLINITPEYQVVITGPRSYLAAPMEGKHQLYAYTDGKLMNLGCDSPNVLCTPTGLFQDPDGTVWISNVSGLYQVQYLPYRYFPSRDIYRVADKNGTMCASFDTLSLAWQDRVGIAKKLRQKNMVLVSIFNDSDIVWYLTNNGLAWRVKQEQNLRFIDTGQGNIFLLAVKDGKTVWFCSTKFIIRYERGRFTKIPAGKTSYTTRSAAADRQHRLWIVRAEGLYVVDSAQRHITDGVPKDQNFSMIGKDWDNHLWIAGVNHHIYRFRPAANNGIIVDDSIASPFPGAQVPARAMVFDRKNNLWVTYANALVIYFFHEGRPVPGKYICLTADNGFMPVIESMRLYATQDDNIIADASPGLVLDAAEIMQRYHTQAPKPYIASILVNNQAFDWYKNGYRLDSTGVPIQPDLAYANRSVTFLFSSIGFNNARYYRYSYRLLGLHENWIKTDINDLRAIYTALPFGRYTFELRVANENGIWSNTIAYKFSVRPPWYFSTVAWIMWTLIGTGIVTTLFWLRQRAVTRALTLEKMELNQKLLTLRAQINPHFIQNTFVFLGYNIINESKDRAMETLKRVGDYIRQVMYKSDLTISTIEDELIFIREYLDMQQVLSENRLSYTIDVSDELDTIGYNVPSMFLQPIVENAVKYSTMQGATGVISIAVYEEGASIVFAVKDNGTVQGKKDPNHISTGLGIAQKKLALMFKNKATYTLQRNEDAGHTARVTIPEHMAQVQ